MPPRFRKVLFWCHLAVGVAVALVVVVMSVTGVLLAYQKQVTAWADARAMDGRPPVAGAVRLPTDSVLTLVRTKVGGTPTAITWRARPHAPVEVAFGREKTVFASAYTGAVLGEGATGVRRFFRVVTDWHRWLGAKGESRAMGKGITGAANLGFLFIVVSGLFLWWPRNLTPNALRSVAFFRRGLSGKARDFNWHHVVGIWSFVPLVLIVASGVVISYGWASGLVYRSVGEQPPAPQGPSAPPGAAARASGEGRGAADRRAPVSLDGIDALRPRAEAKVPDWRAITLTVPKSDTASLAFAIDAGTGGQPQRRATLTLAPGGDELKWEPFSSGTAGRRLRAILRFTHTGEVLGLPGQTIALLVSAGAVLLAWTGLALTWRRFVAWRGRRERLGDDREGAESRPAAA